MQSPSILNHYVLCAPVHSICFASYLVASPSPPRPVSASRRLLPVHSNATPHYNDRLVSSTPVLTSAQRHKQQELKQREQELQQKLEQLKEHYDLLQVQCVVKVHCTHTIVPRILKVAPAPCNCILSQCFFSF